MNGINIISLPGQFFSDLLCLNFSAGKNNPVYAGIEIDDALEYLIAVVVLAGVVMMVDVGIAGVSHPDGYFYRRLHISFGDLTNFGRHRRTKQPQTFSFRGILQYKFNVFLESHVEHLIGLIQNDPFDLLQVDGFSFNQVDQASGRGYHNRSTLFEVFNLAGYGGPSVYRKDVVPFLGVPESVHVLCDLHAEFAGWTYNQSQWKFIAGVYTLEKRQTEGGCFAGAGLGQSDKVPGALQQNGYGFFLNGRRFFKTQFSERGKQAGDQPQ